MGRDRDARLEPTAVAPPGGAEQSPAGACGGPGALAMDRQAAGASLARRRRAVRKRLAACRGLQP